MDVSPASVSVLALKGADDGKGVVLRLQERSGSPNRAAISSAAFNLRETVALAPFEVKTLLLSRDGSGARIRELSTREECSGCNL